MGDDEYARLQLALAVRPDWCKDCRRAKERLLG
jgi:hypothetical protein